jgi:hypothetical protein
MILLVCFSRTRTVCDALSIGITQVAKKIAENSIRTDALRDSVAISTAQKQESGPSMNVVDKNGGSAAALVIKGAKMWYLKIS